MEIKTWGALANEIGISYAKLMHYRKSDLTAPQTKSVDEWKTFLQSKTVSPTDDIEDPTQHSDNLERIRFYKAEREKLQYLKEKKELVVLADFQADELKRYQIAKQQLEKIPAMSTRLVNLTAPEIANELREAIDGALRAICEGIEEQEAEVEGEGDNAI